MNRLLCILGCAWLLAGCAMSRNVPAEPINESDSTRYIIITLRNDAVP